MGNAIALIGFASGCGGVVPGANEGPRILRSLNLFDRIQSLGLDVVDLGDATPDYPAADGSDEGVPEKHLPSPEESSIHNFSMTYLACMRLAQKTQQALDMARFPLVLGGDHSLSIGSVAAIANHHAKRGGKIGLVWVDTHADINTPQTSPSQMAFGMSVAFLLGRIPGTLSKLQQFAPAVLPKNLVYIGLRDLDPGEKAFLREHHIAAFTMREIDIYGMAEVAWRAHEIASKNTGGYTVSFDLDVCDPLYVPGIGTPIRGGLTYREAHLLLELLAAEKHMLSFELVELNPRLDKDFMTAEVALSLVESALGKSIL